MARTHDPEPLEPLIAAIAKDCADNRTAIVTLAESVQTRFDAHEQRTTSLFEALAAETKARFVAVDKRFDAVDASFEATRTRIDAMAERFEAFESETKARFVAVDKRFDAVDKRFDAVEQRFDTMEVRFDDKIASLAERTDRRFDAIEGTLKKHDVYLMRILIKLEGTGEN